MRASLEAAEIAARKIGVEIGKSLPKGWGFVLTLASFGDGSAEQPRRMTYIANVQRGDAVRMLRELAGKIERGEAEV